METIGFRKVKRQVMGQDAVPQLGLGLRHCILGLGQFLNVVRSSHHRVLKDLHRADLQHVRDDLRILWVVLFPTVVCRASRVRARATEDTSFRSNRATPR